MDEQWTLPPAGPDDEILSERLHASGARTKPRTQWDIDCMIRIAARILDNHGLLDADASWIEIRHSRSERAGGLTVQFDPHPDEIDADYNSKALLYFRFRESRPAKSEASLAALVLACKRRAMLKQRDDDIDAGRLSDEGALLCDAVLPAYLRSMSLDPAILEPSLREATRIDVPGPLVDDHGTAIRIEGVECSLQVSHDRNALDVHYLKIGTDIVYKSRGPTVLIRHQQWPETVLSAMAGRPASEFVKHPAFEVPGLEIVEAKSVGDATSLHLTRVTTTLCEPRR